MARRKRKKKLPAYKREKKNIFPGLVITSLTLVFCVFMLYKSNQLEHTKTALQDDISSLENRIEKEEARSEELKEFEIYTHTKKYAEEVAKNILGYVYEDEIIFKPKE